MLAFNLFYNSFAFSQPLLPPTIYYNGENICENFSEWSLVFFDEFNSVGVDTDKWYTWFPNSAFPIDECTLCRVQGTNSDQVYLDENVSVGDNALRIVTNNTPTEWLGQQRNYNSGVIASKIEFQDYLVVEIRCMMPKGVGFWPALWLFGWSTEIDFPEIDTKKPNKVSSSIYHWLDSGTNGLHQTTENSTPGGVNLSDDFHIYRLEYTKYFVKLLIDGILVTTFHRVTNHPYDPIQQQWWTTEELLSDFAYNNFEVFDACINDPGDYDQNELFPVYNNPLGLIINSAVFTIDDDNHDSPNSDTQFPAVMAIDYVRVWQKEASPTLPDLCNFIVSGPDEICSGDQAIYNWSTENPDIHFDFWEVSPNLIILNSDQNHVLVTQGVGNTTEPSFIRVHVQDSPIGCMEKKGVKYIQNGNPILPIVIETYSECEDDFELNIENIDPQVSYTWNIAGGVYDPIDELNFPLPTFGTDVYHILYECKATNACGSSTTYGDFPVGCGNDYEGTTWSDANNLTLVNALVVLQENIYTFDYFDFKGVPIKALKDISPSKLTSITTFDNYPVMVITYLKGHELNRRQIGKPILKY